MPSIFRLSQCLLIAKYKMSYSTGENYRNRKIKNFGAHNRILKTLNGNCSFFLCGHKVSRGSCFV